MPGANAGRRRVPADAITNQVFIGCPWKTVRPKYVKITDRFLKKYPLSFIIIGKEKQHSAQDLLTLIKNKLALSNAAIFDVSGGNANVSLEFGYAEAIEVESALYFNTHQMGARRTGSAAIISDLAGKRRREYKNERRLSELLNEFSKNHSYTLLFEQVFRKAHKKSSKGDKKRARTLWLKLIHLLDDRESIRRSILTSELLSLPHEYKASEVELALRTLHKGSLIRISEGRYSDVRIFTT